MKKLKALTKKIYTKEIIFYIIFTILAVAINIGSFYVLNFLFHIEDNNANLTSIALALLVSYFTNRDVVFHPQTDEFGEKIIGFCKFFLNRLFSMAAEYIGCALLFKYTSISNIVIKTVIAIAVAILSIFTCKLFAFKQKEE